MQFVSALCTPRESVFSDTTRDDVLNLSDLIEGKIDVAKFFNENFKTQGMEILFETAFKRFSGKSDTGVIKLTQAMGGGKTHNMLALALLAQNPEWRGKVFDRDYADVGEIKVVAFSGRENAEFGIWGNIADQLGKKEFFADLYSPLRAPGESAWVNLLSGQKILLLLDELPPYLENAKSIAIGNSDLCKVTVTAISNLFTAIGKEQLKNVCLVFSDLRATYESGSQLLSSSFKELENEASRTALNLELVALNTDEVYDILRKRLFEKYPASSASTVNEIAIAYKDALARAGKSGLTGYTGDAVYLGVKDSYPFHPSIKEIYARFKENPGFQQTRGLIKLMRQVVRGFYQSGNADKKALINVFDIDLNERNMLSLIKQIKPSLEAAISHDIAQGGKAVAEVIDKQNGEKKEKYAQDVASKLSANCPRRTRSSSSTKTASPILAIGRNAPWC
jgi:predicted AAA+ superfamily ATPase